MLELTRRYVVMAMATEAPFDLGNPDESFVLKPWKDPAALRALAAYRDHCYPELARDLAEWIRKIEAGPTVRGDVGRRNETHLKARAAQGGKRAAPRRAAAKRSTTNRRRAAAKPKARKRR